jgi:hypothetical protein
MERLISIDLDSRQVLNQMSGLDLARALSENLSLTRRRLALHTGRAYPMSPLEDALLDFIEGEQDCLASRDDHDF